MGSGATVPGSMRQSPAYPRERAGTRPVIFPRIHGRLFDPAFLVWLPLPAGTPPPIIRVPRYRRRRGHGARKSGRRDFRLGGGCPGGGMHPRVSGARTGPSAPHGVCRYPACITWSKTGGAAGGRRGTGPTAA